MEDRDAPVDIDVEVHRFRAGAEAAAAVREERAYERQLTETAGSVRNRVVALPGGEQGLRHRQIAHAEAVRATGALFVSVHLTADSRGSREVLERDVLPLMPGALTAITRAAPSVLDARLAWWR